MVRRLAICTLLLTMAAAAGLSGPVAPASAATRCGSFTIRGGLRVIPYRVRGSQSCAYVRRIARAAIGSRCQGEVVRDGFRCTRGAPALGEPAATGFRLRRGRSDFQARVRG